MPHSVPPRAAGGQRSWKVNEFIKHYFRNKNVFTNLERILQNDKYRILRQASRASPPSLICPSPTRDHLNATETGDDGLEEGSNDQDEKRDDNNDDDGGSDNEDSGLREFAARLRYQGERDIPRHLQPLQLEARCSNFKSHSDEMRSDMATSSSSTG